nr:TonB-dependent receptor [Pseudomonas aeruginosa]
MPDVRLSSRSLTPVLCAVGLACALQGEVQAADGGPRDVATAPRVFDIAPGELAEVLLNIVRQGHVPIAFDQRLVAGLRGPDIRGRLSVEDALRRALAGSGLAYAQDESGAFVLRRGQAPVQETRGATVAPTLSTVVVTGTRKSDVKAQDSLSPIDVVSATQLRSSGAVDLRDALVKLLPSLTRQAQPFNASALTHTQSLRGLSPNHVLVLVNGKRRHETANLNISGGLEKGSTGVDLDTIPINAIERVEVLRDGASAQYGSDAIAGVINVILKSADSGGWADWDLSSGYGADRPDIGMTQSVNAAIYRETGNSPRSFDLARYRNSQWTSNLDLGREFELDFLAAPLALSLGAEYRRESYRIDAGDPASYYSGGAESLAGLSPLSEGQWSRHAWASYLDLGTSLTPAWEVDVAVRHEKFSDFGSTTNGKFATRYQFDPRVALRASVSSGFRAPSLVQEHYTGLSVGPTIALGLLAANSPAAKMLGADELQPEKSTSFNLGLVLSPWENVGLNIDAYQISIRDRIVDSATYSGQEAIDALAAAGISLPASASTVSTHYLANGADTRTRGVDITGHYLVALGEYGQVDWELSANFNRTTLRKNHRGANGEPLLNAQQVAWITSSTPRSQVSLGGTWSRQDWEVSLRLTRYGRTSSELDYTVGPDAWSTEKFNHFVNDPKYITDIAARYRLSADLTLTAGADNLFDVRPDKLPAQNTTYGDVLRYDTYASQIGFNGAFYYLRAAYRF